MPTVIGRVRARIAELGIRHSDVAHQLHIHPSLLSAFLNGRRQLPPDFEQKAHAALDLLEHAEAAAAEARAKALQESA